jgi:outer membrane biogenesis lipoprotein LolB
VRTWRTFVEQLQLRNAGAGEVIQHHTGFGIPVPVLPDTLQSRCGGRNDVRVSWVVSSFSVATLP